MTCAYRNSNSDTLLQCMGLSPIYSEAQVSQYADRTGATPSDVRFFAISCLRVNRMIRPNIPEGPCGQNRTVATPEQQAFVALGGLAQTDPEPVSHAILTGVAAIGNFFSGLFSGAPSKQELQTDCAVVSAYNQFAAAIEQAIKSNQISVQQAISYLNQAYSSLNGQLATLQGYSIQSWAPYFHRKSLDALQLFNTEFIYPGLATSGILGGNSGVLILGGGLVAAKAAGAF